MAKVSVVQPAVPNALEVLAHDYLASCRARGLAPTTIRTAYKYTLDDIFLPWCAANTITEVDQLSQRTLDRFNLRGVAQDEIRRGNPLLTPSKWRPTDVVDVRTRRAKMPAQAVLHVGSAAVAITLRSLPGGGEDGEVFRLRLGTPLPLQVGDRILLRHPGRQLVLGGATVLDPAPPALRRRGAARARAAALADDVGTPVLARELARRGASRVSFLPGHWGVAA